MNNIPLISRDLSHAAFPSSSSAVLVYFSAHWCGPCRQFTPLLKTFYDFAKEAGANLEVIFVSSDRSEHEMVQYYQQSHGNWLAVPFYSTQRSFLSGHFGVKGIPALFLLNKGTLHAVEEDVRLSIQQVAMSRSSHRVLEIVDSWRVRSGAVLFEDIPKSMSMLAKEDRESVFQLLTRVIKNIAEHPTESKYRQLRSDNAVLNSTILEKSCGDLPLLAIGFRKSLDVYEYRFGDATTTHVVLVNRNSNGVSDITACAPTLATPVGIAATPSLGKLRILYRDNAPVETEDPVESMEMVGVIVESITDVADPKMFAPEVQKLGPLNLSDPSVQTAFRIAFASHPVVDLLVLSSTTNFSSDEEANQNASELRAKLSQLSASNIGLSQVFNAAIQCQIYQVPSHQAKALEVVPVWDLHAKRDSARPYSEGLFVSLLNWFKTDFFSWVDKPRCGQCRALSTTLVNSKAPPTLQEAKGLATVVELFTCEVCGSLTRFPRFNHPVALLHTRSGRCGEWSNCFALIATALGFEIRRVYDSADHVWVEVWMEHRREWVHCDPCENVYDQPLLYEQGWGKASTFTFACAKDGVRDVTKRYTSKAKPVSPSGMNNINSPVLQQTNEILQHHWPERLAFLVERDEEEDVALNLMVHAPTADLAGRTSGAPEWVVARQEDGFFIGNDNDEIDSSPCCGPNIPDSVPFSNEHQVRTIAADSGIPQLRRIDLWANTDNYLTGIHCEYYPHLAKLDELESDSPETTGQPQLAADAIGKNPVISLQLEKSMHITKIEAKYTEKGVCGFRLFAGEEELASLGDLAGGTDMSELHVIEGTHIIGFMGSMGTVIHTLGILTAPISPEES